MASLKGHCRVYDKLTTKRKKLTKFIKSIEVHAVFSSEDQAMLTYNMDFGEPIGVCRVAASMTFKDGLIVRNEIFFDTRPFGKN